MLFTLFFIMLYTMSLCDFNSFQNFVDYLSFGFVPIKLGEDTGQSLSFLTLSDALVWWEDYCRGYFKSLTRCLSPGAPGVLANYREERRALLVNQFRVKIFFSAIEKMKIIDQNLLGTGVVFDSFRRLLDSSYPPSVRFSNLFLLRLQAAGFCHVAEEKIVQRFSQAFTKIGKSHLYPPEEIINAAVRHISRSYPPLLRSPNTIFTVKYHFSKRGLKDLLPCKPKLWGKSAFVSRQQLINSLKT
jgi:hypothetical protein